jgi:hypothetical protein
VGLSAVHILAAQGLPQSLQLFLKSGDHLALVDDHRVEVVVVALEVGERSLGVFESGVQ